MRKGIEFGLAVLTLGLLGADFYQGSGIFGKWIRDDSGLVAYQYEMDQTNDPRARWIRGSEQTNLAWHQIGNLHINAIAANAGFVQLFYNDSAQRWLNYYDPARLAYSGGFGFVLEGDTSFATYYPYSPKGSVKLRLFGQGYFEKEMEHNQLLLNETIFAPAGDLPVLIMRVKLKNLSPEKRSVQYFAYFDVNPMEIKVLASQAANKRASDQIKFTPEINPEKSLAIARSDKIWSKDGGYPPKVIGRDRELPDIFLASLDAKAIALAVNKNDIFTGAGFKGSAGLKNLLAAASLAPRSPGKNFALFNMVKVELEPGQEQVLNFAYGYAKAQKVEDLLLKVNEPGKLWEQTIDYWKSLRPDLSAGQDQFLSRELEWNNYYLASSFLYDAYYNRHFAPQGGHYVYVLGIHGATRDLAGFILGLIYFEPELAREMIELCLSSQESSGRMFYDFEGYGKRYTIPYRPSDLSLWILWAASEYVFATRDFAFLQKELPFWPKEKGEKGTVLEHLVRAYQHLEKDIGTGRHNLIQLRMSDWNDQMTLLVTRNDPLDFILTFFDGESALNSAMACDILPIFSGLLKAAGEGKQAAEVDAFYDRVKIGLQKQWLSQGWFPRAYSALGKSFGTREIFLEPQVWALLSDNLLSADQQDLLLKNIDRKLRQPSKLGMMISSDVKGSLFAKPGTQERGGIWFAINGPGAYALARHNPEMGFEELKKNTLAWHAIQYPELWYGIWSGPDSFNSVFSDRPGQTWLESKIAGGPSLFPVMNNNSHGPMMWALARMAGFNPTAEGYLIDPLIPLEQYRLQTKFVGIEKNSDQISGYFIFPTEGWITLRVKLPPGFRDKIVVAVDGRETIVDLQNHEAKFPVSFQAGKRVDWRINQGRR